MQTIVYKVGGSLFDLPDLSQRLGRLLARRRPHRPLLVAGGGRAADVVRRWDEIHRLGDHSAHWLAIRALTLNESLLQQLLPGSQIVGRRDEAESVWRQEQVAIICAERFLVAELIESDSQLPHTWDVSSDSIAAWIALRWPADELVLVKSATLSKLATCDRERRLPPVDPYFAALAPRLPAIRWVNLRAEQPQLEAWSP